MNKPLIPRCVDHPADERRSGVPPLAPKVCKGSSLRDIRDEAGQMLKRPGSVLDLIGNTPLVKLHSISGKPQVHVYAKLEEYNPGGSIKDRPVHEMLTAVIEAGELRPGMTVLEASSGNTGTSLAWQCGLRGLPCTVGHPCGDIAPQKS